MNDPHTPLLSSLVILPDEHAAIIAALATNDPWNEKADCLAPHRKSLEALKDKLLALHMARQSGRCCYCRNYLADRGAYVRDREHILPKGKFKSLSYTPFNISVACKRCNMSIKGSKSDFIVDLKQIDACADQSDQYLIVHPNFDVWEDHLEHFHLQFGSTTIITYSTKSGSGKGAYTYDFFKLKDLSVESLDTAQGLTVASDSIKLALKALKDNYDQ